jgi:putative transposase
VETSVPLARVCRLLAAPRSTIYARRGRAPAPGGGTPARGPRGPRPQVSDEALSAMIRDVLRETPFAGEGHRKVTARLRRDRAVYVGRKRVLRLMRQAGLLAPQRARGRRTPRPHDGTIIPAAPDRLWGTDATMAYTQDDGWVWAFIAVDHFSAEAWATVAKRGDRFAATEPIYDAVRQRFGVITPDVARGIAVRHDWGPQYTSGHFQGALRWLGLEPSPAFAGEPPCNGCAERCIRTLKEQCLWARTYVDLDDLRTAVRAFLERYNTLWLIERHGHRTPREAYAHARQAVAA